MVNVLFKWSTFYFIIHHQSDKQSPKIKRAKKYPPFENKDIEKEKLINLPQKLAKKLLLFYKGN